MPCMTPPSSSDWVIAPASWKSRKPSTPGKPGRSVLRCSPPVLMAKNSVGMITSGARNCGRRRAPRSVRRANAIDGIAMAVTRLTRAPALRARSRGATTSAPSSRCPVFSAKTSSSVGRTSSMPSTAKPASSSARTTGAIAAAPSTTRSDTWAPGVVAHRSPNGATARPAASASGASPSSVMSRCGVPTSAFSAAGVPSATSRPWSMIPTRSASWSASSRYCVVRKTVVPSSRSRRTSSHSVVRDVGSRPVVGSSRNRTSGSWISAIARSSRRRMPPE